MADSNQEALFEKYQAVFNDFLKSNEFNVINARNTAEEMLDWVNRVLSGHDHLSHDEKVEVEMRMGKAKRFVQPFLAAPPSEIKGDISSLDLVRIVLLQPNTESGNALASNALEVIKIHIGLDKNMAENKEEKEVFIKSLQSARAHVLELKDSLNKVSEHVKTPKLTRFQKFVDFFQKRIDFIKARWKETDPNKTWDQTWDEVNGKLPKSTVTGFLSSIAAGFKKIINDVPSKAVEPKAVSEPDLKHSVEMRTRQKIENNLTPEKAQREGRAPLKIFHRMAETLKIYTAESVDLSPKKEVDQQPEKKAAENDEKNHDKPHP